MPHGSSLGTAHKARQVVLLRRPAGDAAETIQVLAEDLVPARVLIEACAPIPPPVVKIAEHGRCRRRVDIVLEGPTIDLRAVSDAVPLSYHPSRSNRRISLAVALPIRVLAVRSGIHSPIVPPLPVRLREALVALSVDIAMRGVDEMAPSHTVRSTSLATDRRSFVDFLPYGMTCDLIFRTVRS